MEILGEIDYNNVFIVVFVLYFMNIECEVIGGIEKRIKNYDYIELEREGCRNAIGVEFENLKEYYEKAEDFMGNFSRNKWVRTYFGRKTFSFKINEPFIVDKIFLDAAKVVSTSKEEFDISYLKLSQGDENLLTYCRVSENIGKKDFGHLEIGDSIYVSLTPSAERLYDLKFPKFGFLAIANEKKKIA